MAVRGWERLPSVYGTWRGGLRGVHRDTEGVGAVLTITMDPGWVSGQTKRRGREAEPRGQKQETERPTEAALGQVRPVHCNSFSSPIAQPLLSRCPSVSLSQAAFSTGTSQQHPFWLVRQVSPENLPPPKRPDISRSTMSTWACFLSVPVRACLLLKCEPTLYRVGSISGGKTFLQKPAGVGTCSVRHG